MKEVVQVQVKEVVFVLGVKNPNFGPTISNRSDLKNFRMIYLDSGAVEMSWEEGAYLRGFIIPEANIKGIALASVKSVNAASSNVVPMPAAQIALKSAQAS